jgi:DNA-binding transcriptional LysR family regulator
VAPPRTDGLEELRLQDLLTFLNVQRLGSVTAAARELGVTPSQVSKAVARIEAGVRLRLFVRGPRGISLSSAGRQVLPKLEQIATLLRSLGRAGRAPEGELTIAAPSSLLPPILPRVIKALPGMRVRGIELPPALLRGYAGEELFDVALLPGAVTGLPSKWASTRVGELRKSLFASPSVARKLGHELTIEQLRAAPFVGPIVYDGGKFVSSTDDCPLPLEERAVASEVGTMGLALQIAATCGQLVFGPVIAAHREIAEGTLVEVPVKGWNVHETLFLACDAERVLARVQTAIVETVRAVLDGSRLEDELEVTTTRKLTKPSRS